ALGRRVVASAAAIEETQSQLVAAVVDVVEDGPVALRRILGREQEDVGLELNLALPIARSQVEVNNRAVVSVVGVDGKPSDADDLLVRAGIPERLAAGKGLALEDGQRHQGGPGHDRAQQKHNEDGQQLKGAEARSVQHGGALSRREIVDATKAILSPGSSR